MFYGRTGEVIEIIVRDFSGGKLDSFKFNVTDTDTARKIMKVLKSKYGFDVNAKDRDIG